MGLASFVMGTNLCYLVQREQPRQGKVCVGGWWDPGVPRQVVLGLPSELEAFLPIRFLWWQHWCEGLCLWHITACLPDFLWALTCRPVCPNYVLTARGIGALGWRSQPCKQVVHQTFWFVSKLERSWHEIISCCILLVLNCILIYIYYW